MNLATYHTGTWSKTYSPKTSPDYLLIEGTYLFSIERTVEGRILKLVK